MAINCFCIWWLGGRNNKRKKINCTAHYKKIKSNIVWWSPRKWQVEILCCQEMVLPLVLLQEDLELYIEKLWHPSDFMDIFHFIGIFLFTLELFPNMTWKPEVKDKFRKGRHKKLLDTVVLEDNFYFHSFRAFFTSLYLSFFWFPVWSTEFFMFLHEF